MLVTEGTPGVSGVTVHNSGNDGAVGVLGSKVGVAVGGGKGLRKVCGLTKILMKITANPRPASMTSEASMSQNLIFIASLVMADYFA